MHHWPRSCAYRGVICTGYGKPAAAMNSIGWCCRTVVRLCGTLSTVPR
jgi:hypothetical protein